MTKTNIEWTQHVWNPFAGCSILSPGCTNCYAMKRARRIEACNAGLSSGHSGAPHYAGTTKIVNGNAVWTGKIGIASDDVLLAPLKRKKPTTWFVNSMSDLFHENVPDEVIDRVFAIMALTPQHTYQVLTKRSARMRQWFAADRADSVGLTMLTIVDRIPHGHRRVPWPLPNVWLGVSTERQKEADERIPDLLATPAAVRFISAEPLLGPIDLTAIRWRDEDAEVRANALTAEAWVENSDSASAYTNEADGNTKLDLVIVGGESGHGARPMHPDWARSLRDQCAAAGVKFFFKQWGAWAPSETASNRMIVAADGDIDIPDERTADEEVGEAEMARVGKKAAGRLLDGVEHNAMPEAAR